MVYVIILFLQLILVIMCIVGDFNCTVIHISDRASEVETHKSYAECYILS